MEEFLFKTDFDANIFDELESELGESTLTEYFTQDFEPLLSENGDAMPLFDMLDNRSDSSDSGIDCLPTSPTLSDANSEHQYTFERGSLMDEAMDSNSPEGETATIYVVEDPSGAQRVITGDELMNWNVKVEDEESLSHLSLPQTANNRRGSTYPTAQSTEFLAINPQQQFHSQQSVVSGASKVPCVLNAQSQNRLQSQRLVAKQPQHSAILPGKTVGMHGKQIVQPIIHNGQNVGLKFVTSNTPQTVLVKNSQPVLVPDASSSSTLPVDYFVNTKVKIQPKPQQRGAARVAVATSSNLPHFAVAPQPEMCETSTMSVINGNSVTSPLPFDGQLDASSALYAVEVNDSSDLQLLKRHHRMIKNRESASLSRKRRKDYLKSLEDTLKQCLSENQNLVKENKVLKRKVDDLQGENEKLRKFSGAKKSAVVLFGVMLLVALNLPGSGIVLNGVPVDDKAQYAHLPLQSFGEGSHRFGRTLLSVDDSADSQLPSDLQQALDALRRGLGDINETTTMTLRDSIMCPTYHNQTDSIRLVNELRNWVLGHKEEWKRQVSQPGRQGDAVRKMEQPETGGKKKRARAGSSRQAGGGAVHNADKRRTVSHDTTDSGIGHGHQYELQLFMAADNRYRRFLEAIHRRNDTFYVVSFHKDHLLLPATFMNKTAPRPRMSLVMPAVGLNESMQPPKGSVAMMQVDCDVTATRLIYLHNSAMPHVAANNATYGPHRSSGHESWLNID